MQCVRMIATPAGFRVAAVLLQNGCGEFALRMTGGRAEEFIYTDRHRRPAPFRSLLTLHRQRNSAELCPWSNDANVHFFFFDWAAPPDFFLPPPSRSEPRVEFAPPASKSDLFFEVFPATFAGAAFLLVAMPFLLLG